MHARNGAVFHRLTKLMREHAWEPIRIKLNGVDGGGVTERVREFQRKTNKCRIRRCLMNFRAR